MTNRSQLRAMLIDEREQLHRVLEGLTEEQWLVQSLCHRWSVLEVAGHLASVVGITRLGMLGRNLRYGAGTDRGNHRAASDWAAKGSAAIVAALGDPDRLGLGYYFPKWGLAETVVHQYDIRRPLDLERSIPSDRVRIALDVFLRLAVVTKEDRRWRTVGLRATDMEWRHGAGPEIAGTGQAILLALTGRSGSFDDLVGEGRHLVKPA